MQYDENAEKYGYEGEMTPLKCDELKVYAAPTPDETGLADYCLKSDVDAAIAELKAKLENANMENRSLHRALYKACANWAHFAVAFFSSYATKEKWYRMKLKCLKKMEEYK